MSAMKFVNPLPFVKDINRAKRFYADVMRLVILEDRADFVRFEHGFALHDGASLSRTVFADERPSSTPYGRENLVLYFEAADLEEAFDRIAPHVELIHPIERQSWGQRVFRFYDPDRHLVEVGEPQ